MKTISLGNQSFASIRERDYFYIDKTDFIREWWEAGDVATLITRPRRFGKTLNMDMLDCFFSDRYAGRADLFEGLSIWGEEEYRRLQGTYPVIFLTFADVKERTFPDAYTKLCEAITRLYDARRFLREGDVLTDNEREQFRSVTIDMRGTTATSALRNLSGYLSRYHGRKVIILLDEYDTPMQEAYVHGYWDEMVSFTRSLSNATFKTNPYLERAVITGITRISRESMFSDLNNLNVVTTTTEQYETAFGFTQEEVSRALELSGMEEEGEDVRRWYDGFTFGKHTDIYNPWSITSFLRWKSFGAYWVNTSSNALLSSLLREGDADTKRTMEDLLAGKPLTARIDEQVVFDQLNDDESAIWSLMLASGYLKVQHSESLPDDGEIQYELALTNHEVYLMLKRIIRQWFRRSSADYNNLIRALLHNDKKMMNRYMNRVALQTFSFFDVGNGPSGRTEPERFYHGFVLGLIVELSGRYHIASNRESGFGRYDVMLKPLSREDTAYVLEFKVQDTEDEGTLEDTVQAALQQIRDKGYDAELLAEGYPAERIRHYGFAFRGKEVLIG